MFGIFRKKEGKVSKVQPAKEPTDYTKLVERLYEQIHTSARMIPWEEYHIKEYRQKAMDSYHHLQALEGLHPDFSISSEVSEIIENLKNKPYNEGA